MKQLAIFICLVFASKISFSQLSHFVSLGPDLGIPAKNLGAAKLGWGGSLEYQVKFNAPVGAQLHIGHTNFTNKSNSNSKITFLPVRAGIVGFIYQDLIFLYADAGFSHYHSPSSGTNQNGFSFGAGFGSRYILNNKYFVQVSGYYNLHNFKSTQFSNQNYNYNWFNIRAAFGLNWGKGKRVIDAE